MTTTATSTPASASTTTQPATTTTTTAAEPMPVTVEPGVEPTGQVIEGTIDTPDGRTRTYRLYVPRTLPDSPVPLLIALHGGTGWGAQLERTSGFDRLAEANGFLVAYPDGVGTPPEETSMRTWNGGYCCGAAVRLQVDDVAFVAALIDRIASDHDVDGARTYAAGHSNGGIMAYRLACELADRIVAVGVVAGSLGVDACDPADPVSLLHIHGTADTNHPIDGGVGPTGISGVDFHPAIDGVRTVAAADGCDDGPTTATDGDLTTSTWTGCSNGTEVRFVAIEGASHAWPGSTGGARPGGPVPYAGYDASYEVVAFLLAHPRPR